MVSHWIYRLTIWLAVSIASLSPASADEYGLLAAQLVAAGTNEYEDERHTVEIEDCVITTYRWRHLPEHGWTLWSSFNFHISDVALSGPMAETGGRYVYVSENSAPDEVQGVLIISFEARGDTLIRHERSNLRDPTPTEQTGPSPRGDGQSYYYEWRDKFFILMQGPYGPDKGDNFTLAYERIAFAFCGQIG